MEECEVIGVEFVVADSLVCSLCVCGCCCCCCGSCAVESALGVVCADASGSNKGKG